MIDEKMFQKRSPCFRCILDGKRTSFSGGIQKVFKGFVKFYSGKPRHDSY